MTSSLFQTNGTLDVVVVVYIREYDASNKFCYVVDISKTEIGFQLSIFLPMIFLPDLLHMKVSTFLLRRKI